MGPLAQWLGPLRNRREVIPIRRVRTVPATYVGAQVLELGGGEQIPCPGAQMLPLSDQAIDLGLGYATLALPPAQMFVLERARLCPGSRVVMSRDGRVIAESLSRDMLDTAELIATEVNGPMVEMSGAIAFYQSPRSEPFHGLIDHLPRAALFAQPLTRRLGRVTLIHEGPLSDIDELWLDRLSGPAVEVLRAEAGTALTAERVFLPSYVTRPQSGAVPSWYRNWVDRSAAALPAVPPNAHGTRRYFVDRLGGGRTVANRSELDQVLERHRITALAPSGLEARERIATFRDAELVVGVTGSGMSNLLFSRRAEVIELLPGARLFPHCYYLTRAKGLPYHYLKAPEDALLLSEVERLNHPVVVDTEGLDALLTKLAENLDEPPPDVTPEVA